MCGPYIRAYGLGLDRYVALVGPWLVAAGAPVEAVLPWPLDVTTDHVHDLWSVPLVSLLAEVVVPWLELRTDLPRRHEQRFDGVVAESLLTPDAALGAETGRRPEFAATQHVPVTVHHATGWVGAAAGDGAVGLDASIEGPDGSAAVVAVVVPGEGAPSVAVRTLWSDEPVDLAVGAIALSCSPPPASVAVREDHPGWWATLTWDGAAQVVLRFAVG
jgi:hypothetical protein